MAGWATPGWGRGCVKVTGRHGALCAPWAIDYQTGSSTRLVLTCLQAGGHALSLVVPCADMANHSDAPNAEYRLDADAGCFQLFATRVRLTWDGGYRAPARARGSGLRGRLRRRASTT